MLQPSGAMALFVLRLAGLLSLEKALKENASIQINDTKTPLANFSYYYLDYDDIKENDNLTLRSDPRNDTKLIPDLDDVPEEKKTHNISMHFQPDFNLSYTPEIQISKTKNSTNYTKSGVISPTSSNDDVILSMTNLTAANDFSYDGTYNPLNTSSALPPRDQNTGFSKVFSEEFEKEMSKKEPPYPKVFPSVIRPVNISSLNLTDEQEKYYSFVASPENFVSPIFLDHNDTEDVDEDFDILSSRSLVIPVPTSINQDQNTTVVYNDNSTLESSPTIESDKQNVSTIVHLEEVSTLTTRGIGPIIPERTRNILSSINPYPYGPKTLPGSHIPFSKDLEPEQAATNSMANLIPDKSVFYDYSENGAEGALDLTQDRLKLIAKTEEPRVFFHFDKPGGYSPKLPDFSLPPTRAPTPSDPWDCIPRCPTYKLVDWNPDYDIRLYPETTWISTVIISRNRILAELEGYMKVQDYFYGLNDRGLLMNLTIPFLTQIKYGRHPGVLEEAKDFVISLYISHQDDPIGYDLPTPISNEVLIDHLESKTVFVGGFEANVWEVTEEFLKKKVTQLMMKLRQNGEAFLDRYYYLASYSRPELYQPVYYEIWIYATTFRESNPSGSSFGALFQRELPASKITSETVDRLCRGVECPPFEVLRTYRYGIQKRRYYNALFVTTFPGECQFSTISAWKGFMPLHLYKHGINSHMEVIEATRPIAMVHVKEDMSADTECPQNMTMAIYLPKRLHSNPPLTGFAAPHVSVNALQDVVVYAYTVGGYLLEPSRVRKELADMKYRLAEFGACFKDDEYYIVVYDFIVRYHGRQNELWIVAENCKATKNG